MTAGKKFNFGVLSKFNEDYYNKTSEQYSDAYYKVNPEEG